MTRHDGPPRHPFLVPEMARGPSRFGRGLLLPRLDGRPLALPCLHSLRLDGLAIGFGVLTLGLASGFATLFLRCGTSWVLGTAAPPVVPVFY